MKRYFKLLWKKFSLTFVIVIFILSLVTGYSVKFQMNEYITSIHNDAARINFANENKEEFDHYYGTSYYTHSMENRGYPEESSEEIDRAILWYEKNIIPYQDAEKDKKMTSDYLLQYKKDSVEFYKKYRDIFPYNIYQDNGYRLIPESEKSITNLGHDSAQLEIVFENTLKYSKIYIGTAQIMMLLLAFVFLGIIFSVFLMSLDHFTRFKMFEQTLPLDGKLKYLTKLLFGIVWLLIYLVINAVILLVMGKLAFGEVFDIQSLFQGYVMIGAQGILFFGLMMFIGSFTGNMLGHLAAMVPILMGYDFFIFLYPLHNIWSTPFTWEWRTKMNESFAVSLLSPSSIFTMKLNLSQLVTAIVLILVLTIVGAYFNKIAKYEDSGKFFTIKWINILYYIFAVWTFASILTFLIGGIVQGFMVTVIFIIFAIFFAKIFQILFRVRMGV